MNNEDRGKFANSMHQAALTLGGQKPTEAVLRRYWDLLREYPVNLVVSAIGEAERREQFFPKPSTIIRYIDYTIEERGRENQEDKQKEWERDRRENPDEYYTPEEITEVMAQLRRELGFTLDFGNRTKKGEAA